MPATLCHIDLQSFSIPSELVQYSCTQLGKILSTSSPPEPLDAWQKGEAAVTPLFMCPIRMGWPWRIGAPHKPVKTDTQLHTFMK